MCVLCCVIGEGDRVLNAVTDKCTVRVREDRTALSGDHTEQEDHNAPRRRSILQRVCACVRVRDKDEGGGTWSCRVNTGFPLRRGQIGGGRLGRFSAIDLQNCREGGGGLPDLTGGREKQAFH